MRRGLSAGAVISSLLVLASFITPPVASAAQTLAQVKAQVTQLEEEATTAAEGAQEAKVKLAELTRSLAGIQAEAEAQGKTVDAISKTLGTIAINQYMSGSISQSMELLFSSDPTLYLSSAGVLEAITRRKSTQLRRFQSAEQKLNATSLTVSDRLAQVKVQQKKFAAQSSLATAKLEQAQAVLANLKKEDRERLAKISEDQENADQAASLKAAKNASAISGRGGIALRFALKQIGDRYVFGADGMTYWDCSGLTMRAFQAAGVSLPHSSAAQSRMGKSIPFNQKKPGDLLFYGRPVSHVSIYMGRTQMVHAPRSGSRVKVVESLSMGPKQLVAVRRF
ncbi:MAG: NlpC/P60 family protein [Candidatus Planktophila sp.]|mgnify:FL=1|jgi:peptidoglycan DL-endopeptidase CwlO|tara:strand:- start:13585 stop:14598 length:1014 start_codon:yes stop_codon:yes gene_type:complete